jgi:hypothetical protein
MDHHEEERVKVITVCKDWSIGSVHRRGMKLCPGPLHKAGGYERGILPNAILTTCMGHFNRDLGGDDP